MEVQEQRSQLEWDKRTLSSMLRLKESSNLIRTLLVLGLGQISHYIEFFWLQTLYPQKHLHWVDIRVPGLLAIVLSVQIWSLKPRGLFKVERDFRLHSDSYLMSFCTADVHNSLASFLIVSAYFFCCWAVTFHTTLLCKLIGGAAVQDLQLSDSIAS